MSSAQEANARPAFIAIGLVVFLLIFTLWKCGQNTTSNLIGFILPTYFSFLALHSKDTEDDIQWLTYWVCYAFFVCAESVTDAFINWVPLYYVVKSALLIWMQHPSTHGAKIVFHNIIDPLMTAMEKTGEAFFDENKRAELKEKLASPDAFAKLRNALPSSAEDEAKKMAQKEAEKALKQM